MPVTHESIGRDTPMGATLGHGGATFRTWAPAARDVYVVTAAEMTAEWTQWVADPANRLVPLGDGTWAGFVPGMADGAPYLFWVRGPEGGTEGFKRDPHARELALHPPFPYGPCILREPHAYPWHATGWRTPPFHRFVIYQLHVGVIQLLPVQEYDGEFGLGYAGLDYFSPEMAYHVDDPVELADHLEVANRLLAEHGASPLTAAALATGPNQLKCLIDLCHLNGIAVVFDLVFNHAGGGFDDRSIWYYDRQAQGDDDRSLYFNRAGWAGGKVFAYRRDAVRQYLIDNALFWLDEYRVDGIRYDEVTVIHHHDGDRFCRDLTATLRYARPDALQIAEYWDWDRALPVTPPPAGLGFDAALGDGLRDALRLALAAAARGTGAHVPLDRARDALYPPPGFPDAWRTVQCLENHDVVRWDYDSHRPRAPRVPALADPTGPHAWYGRSRTRVATALLLTAPGIPMLFMGQEILEEKPWHDDIRFWAQFRIGWDALATDPARRDFLRFVQDLVRLRRRLPGLAGDGVRVPQVHEADRVIVLHRWVEGEGRDVVVVASLAETTREAYPIEMPHPGHWHEVFNSDVYDHFPNPWAAGNPGGVTADGPPGAVYPHTARVRVPTNSVIVLAREG